MQLVLDVKQSKNKRYRPIVLNGITVESVQNWLHYHPKAALPDAPLLFHITSKEKR